MQIVIVPWQRLVVIFLGFLDLMCTYIFQVVFTFFFLIKKKVQAVFVAYPVSLSMYYLQVLVIDFSRDCSGMVFAYFTSLICFWYRAEDLLANVFFACFCEP